MSVLLDTDICSAHLRGTGTIVSRIQQLTGRIHVSAITLGDVFALRRRAARRRLTMVQAFISDVTVLPIDAEVSRKFGELRSQLLDVGRPVPVIDLWIAATALANELTLVTHNTQDFSSIPNLSLADWLSNE